MTTKCFAFEYRKHLLIINTLSSFQESEITIVDTPGVGDNPKTTKAVFDHLKEAFGFVFVINTHNRGGVQDRVSVNLVSPFGIIGTVVC
jgi:hypothetical protein